MGDFFLRNAWVRAIVPLVLIAIVGVSTGALVTEATVSGVVDWRLMPGSIYFYATGIAGLISALYQVAINRYDKELESGFTAKQYEARIRSRVAEDVARRSQRLIRDGDIETLEKETEAFKRLYGEKGQ